MKYYFTLLIIFAVMSCNAQTLPSPSLQTPIYESLLNLPPSSAEKSLILSSMYCTSKTAIPAMPPSQSTTNLLKVTTISPTHYVDTHNAFFCRMERKINKKFVMPVRIRLEGF